MEDIIFIIGVIIGWVSLLAVISYVFKKIFGKHYIDNRKFSSVEIDNTSTTTKKINNEDANDSLLNPVSGGLMMGGMGGIDTFGNSFGSDTCGGFND